jgi:hypothetical protein
MIPIDIEALLTWAWTIELPKANAATEPVEIRTRADTTWGVERRPIGVGGGFAAMQADLDDLDFRNRFGVTPDRGARVGPHPDAVTVHAAVRALDWTDFVFPAGWSPYADMGDDLGDEGVDALRRGLDRVTVRVGDEQVARRRLARQLVERHAVLGTAPDWRADVPVRKYVRGPAGGGHPAWFRKVTLYDKGGKPYEVEQDGFDARRRRPYPDAYRKTFLDPDPVFAVVLRAEYQLWRMALHAIRDEVGGALTAHRLVASARADAPWVPSP